MSVSTPPPTATTVELRRSGIRAQASSQGMRVSRRLADSGTATHRVPGGSGMRKARQAAWTATSPTSAQWDGGRKAAAGFSSTRTRVGNPPGSFNSMLPPPGSLSMYYSAPRWWHRA